MLRAVGLSRHFGEVRAADDVSFEVASGEIVGLLGHNGAGKTTVMRLLTGFIEPTQGQAFVNDIDVQDDPVGAQSHIGYLPESQPFYSEMTVADYLMFAATVRGIPEEERIEKVRVVIDDTDLKDRVLDTIRTLSRGYQQRVAVAQAIIHQPPVLILDEPTNGLDPTQTLHMRELITRLAKKSTVVLSTHILQEVDAICDRVLIMSNGKLVVDEQLAKLNEAKRIVLNSEASREQLSSVTGLRVDRGVNDREFLLHANSETNIESEINAVLGKLINADIAVHGISPERHDLETLFTSVSEVSHAA